MLNYKEKFKKAEELTYNALKRVYNNNSDSYKAKVGKYDMGDDLTAYGQPIIDYTSITNEFLPALIQLVAFPIFQSHMWNNRLSPVKKGNKPYGFDIEDIYTNPVIPTPYSPDDFTRILKGTKQDTISAFYRENRHDVFQKTITKDMLRGAFEDVVAFSEFIDTLIQTIYAGNEIQEFNLTKRSLDECYQASMFKEKAIDTSSEAGIQNAIEEVKNAYELFQFPSSAYNNYAVSSGTGNVAKVWTKPEDIIVLAKVSTINAIKVKYLAGVFNLTEVEFRDRLILVDDFGWDEFEVDDDGVTGVFKEHHNSDISMVVCDAGLFQIYDTMEVSTEFFNAGNLATNYFLHVWQTYGIRPWANCLVFTETSEPVITSVSPNYISNSALTDTAEYTVLPADYELKASDIVCKIAHPYEDDGAFKDITTENWTEYFTCTFSDNTVTIAVADGISASAGDGAMLSLEIGGIDVICDFFLGE